jgi:hypothetical protein
MNRAVLGTTWCIAVLLSISALLNCFFVFQQIMLQQDLKRLTNENSKAPQYQATIQGMLAELANYAKQHPEIYPIVKRYGINPPTSSGPTTAPATSPSSSKTNKH